MLPDYENYFVKNKYSSWYERLVNFRKTNELKGEYLENHHIIPKCLGGSDESENRVKLTAREHFVAHLLLVKMAKTKRVEFQMMNAVNKFNQNGLGQNRKFNSWEYKKIRESCSYYGKNWINQGNNRENHNERMKKYWSIHENRIKRGNQIKEQLASGRRVIRDMSGENNVNNKFTKEQIGEILNLMIEGWTLSNLSRKYNFRAGYFDELKRILGTSKFYDFGDDIKEKLKNTKCLRPYKNMNPDEIFELFSEKGFETFNKEKKKNKHLMYLSENNKKFIGVTKCL